MFKNKQSMCDTVLVKNEFRTNKNNQNEIIISNIKVFTKVKLSNTKIEFIIWSLRNKAARKDKISR